MSLCQCKRGKKKDEKDRKRILSEQLNDALKKRQVQEAPSFVEDASGTRDGSE